MHSIYEIYPSCVYWGQGFALEDATGLATKGDVDIHSVYATSLPTTHPSFSVQQALDMSERWKAPPLLQSSVELFIGILSASSHFAERMAIRKTWMQYPAIRSSAVVARFFVAVVSCFISSEFVHAYVLMVENRHEMHSQNNLNTSELIVI